MRDGDVAERVRELTGSAALALRPLGASHRWRLYRAELADGREAFVKALPDPDPTLRGVFHAEAEGLRWLGAAPDAPVPEVYGADADTLAIAWVDETGATPEAAERFGRELAALHTFGADDFGAPWPGYIATLPLDNAPPAGSAPDGGAPGGSGVGGATWSDWYARTRLMPYLRIAADAGGLNDADVRLIERVIDRIGDLAGPPEPPARIHGDLWAGNVLWTPGRALLIDPAAHGGHRETDLAMLALFGAPHLDRTLAAYDEVAPLAPGRRERIPLHQLHPLLVHVCLFGTGYRSQTIAAAERALSHA